MTVLPSRIAFVTLADVGSFISEWAVIRRQDGPR